MFLCSMCLNVCVCVRDRVLLSVQFTVRHCHISCLSHCLRIRIIMTWAWSSSRRSHAHTFSFLSSWKYRLPKFETRSWFSFCQRLGQLDANWAGNGTAVDTHSSTLFPRTSRKSKPHRIVNVVCVIWINGSFEKSISNEFRNTDGNHNLNWPM